MEASENLIQYWEVKNVTDTAYKDGKTEGQLEKALQVAKEMLLDNEPIEKIVRYTQLSVDQINLLK
jgi:hypothetical protein